MEGKEGWRREEGKGGWGMEEGKGEWAMEEGKEWTVEEAKEGVWNLRGKILKKPSKQKWMLTTETVRCEVPGIFIAAEVQMEERGGGGVFSMHSRLIFHKCASQQLGAGHRTRGAPSNLHLSLTCGFGRQKVAHPGTSRLP